LSETSAWSGAPAIGAAGRAAVELEAGRPAGAGDATDHELSAASVGGVEIRAASVRGLMHRYREQPRQDRFSVVHDRESNTLVVTVCDGVGSRALSHEAAAFVVRTMPAEYLSSGSWATAIKAINERLTTYAREALDRATEGDKPEDFEMATTFVGLALPLGEKGATDRRASIAWTDDSAVWRLDGPQWTNVTADASTAQENGTHRVSVRALPHREPRFRVVETPAISGAFFVVTDGVGVPLEEAADVRETLAAWWSSPPDVFTFGSQVAFARKSHMDDRTAVGIWLGSEG
jgi:serine/threonine protein phosphatase PrpC